MPLASLADVNDAFVAGRWHSSRVVKNAGTAHALQWADCTFSSGQPAYDAHVGSPAFFTPCVAVKNDAVYFPPIEPGMHRHLVSMTLRSAQAGGYNGPESVVVFDLLGYYPLIDGDSTEIQTMDNSATLPRYSDGDGVIAVMVSHVAPAIQNGVAVITATNAKGEQRVSTVTVPNNGINLVCSSFDATTASSTGALAMSIYCPQGVRSINAIRYTQAPGGLHAIYLVRPIATMVLGDNLVAGEKNFLSHNAFHAPRIYDGAWLGWFSRLTPGTARSVSWWGEFSFAWS